MKTFLKFRNLQVKKKWNRTISKTKLDEVTPVEICKLTKKYENKTISKTKLDDGSCVLIYKFKKMLKMKTCLKISDQRRRVLARPGTTWLLFYPPKNKKKYFNFFFGFIARIFKTFQ